MAKKDDDFKLSAEVVALLKEDRTLTGPQVYKALTAKFPGRKINRNSCSVAVSNARKKLKIRVKRKKGGRKVRRVARPTAVPSVDTVSLPALRSARELLSHTKGDVRLATAVLKEIRALQD